MFWILLRMGEKPKYVYVTEFNKGGKGTFCGWSVWVGGIFSEVGADVWATSTQVINMVQLSVCCILFLWFVSTY